MNRRCPHCGEKFVLWGVARACPHCGGPLVSEAVERNFVVVRVLAGIVLAAIVIGGIYLLVRAILG
jgi:hypothetical protein